MILTSKLEAGVQRELFLLGYRNLLGSMIGGFGAAVVLGMTLWSMRPTRGVLIWTMGAFLMNSLAWYLRISFKQAALADSDKPGITPLPIIARWRRLHTLFVVGSACIWAGIGALLEVNDPRANTLILICVFATLAFGASSHGVHNIQSFLASALFSVPIMLYFLQNAFTQSVLPIAILFGMFGLICSVIAVNANRTVIEAIRLKLSNQELAEQRTREAHRADQASRDKSSFLAAAAHDMRQPVHALLMLQGLLRQSNEPHQQRAILDQMQTATMSIGQLFDSVMELSRLESGSARARMEALEIETFIRDRVTQHVLAAEQKGLRVKVHIGRGALGAWVNTDRVLLMRVLDNLIGNAVRYTDLGGILVCLRKHSARKLYLEVWDTGIGIPRSDLDRVFDPYVQLANEVRNREKGLGLGLAIVKNSAQLMGTAIEVRSRPGRGSRFRLLLGRVAAPPTIVPARDEPSHMLGEMFLSNKRILVIEDDPMVTKAILAVLELWGCEVRHATSYDDMQLGSWPPDLILCDQRLPGRFDGLATLDRLKASFPEVACILQTGEISPEVPAKARARGYTHLAKPVTFDVLGHTIKRALNIST
jgi:two-component system, sensor histidine kinase